jgi:nitrate/nitrite transporter NarK
MFDKKVVGLVEATAAGWGKFGNGAAYLLIPVIYNAINEHQDNEHSWRYSLLLAPCLIIVMLILTWFLSDSYPHLTHHEDDESSIGAPPVKKQQLIMTKVSLCVCVCLFVCYHDHVVYVCMYVHFYSHYKH